MTMKLKHAATRIQKLRRAKGGWAIEATGALSLLVLLVGFSMYNETRGNDRKMAEIAATHHKTVATAASAYVRDHYSELLTAAPAVGNTTTVSFATLQANGYVQPTLSSTNIWGQVLNLRVRRSSTDPKAVQLEGLVIGEGGQGVPHELARGVAQDIGAEGGYTVASGDFCGTNKVAASTLCGTRGVWDRPMADFGAAVAPGHIASALFFKDGMQVNDYLYRHRVPGKPELNTMETYLQMGTGARAVEGQPCYSVAGDTTSPLLANGAIATTTDGLILSCQGGVWRNQPISAYSDSFYDDGFVISDNFCSTGVLPIRTYSFSLEEKSLVIASIVTASWAASGEVYSGIYSNGLCAFNRDTFLAGASSTASATCSTVLSKGDHVLQFCRSNGSTGTKGSIVVVPME